MDILPSEDQAKELAITAAAIGTGLLVKKGLESGYKRTFQEDPPNAVIDRDVNWPKALSWALITGTVIYGVRIAIKRYGGQKLISDQYD
ncbi:DUF4235 domain-containing protein [Flavilitoribacter nigricans]|uniref:DUF4235 domain-containing protein n=1 Tax=Flavilitoribacter nigricans (strain ATCC 23147 / DSM 23189 / NBRC 102662 / NCIMB 1420 / SS-2) TaxID=1122177 RepID=A0A2D0N5R5_FLAN2|nr:DUF4235 domain-containing protein [Flavilitoribacter nigricans]PHN03499.1 hypothetical protein CRP01_26220 [Flavilitoribacter nigricans DSM 23189 = NBRC 102662]